MTRHHFRAPRQRVVPLLAIVVAALIVPVGSPAHAVSADRIVSVHGITGGDEYASLVHVLLRVTESQDLAATAADALRTLGARPVTEHDFRLTGVHWPQFYDHDPSNDVVPQLVNPADDPTGSTATTLLAAQRTWSGVRGSRFAFADAGTTERGAEFDFANTVSWLSPWPYPPSFLGLTNVTFRTDTLDIVDSDFVLNPDRPWSARSDLPAPDEVDLETVLLHENGHVAGIDHSANPAAVMGAYLPNGIAKRALTEDDAAAIAALYPVRRPATTLPPPQGPGARAGVVARIDDPAPGGGVFSGGFQAHALNERNVPVFVADFFVDRPLREGGVGAYLANGAGTLIARSLRSAGEGRFFGYSAPGMDVNGTGEVAFAFEVNEFAFPEGANVGLYRYSAPNGVVIPVLVPGQTTVPGAAAGATFDGVAGGPDINDAGDVVFAGLAATTSGPEGDLGLGVYRSRPDGTLVKLVAPGDAAPGGGVFDLATSPSINVRGDVAFGGHERGTCASREPFAIRISCDDSSLYLREASGTVRALVRAGEVVPGVGAFASAGYPVVNDKREVLFLGERTDVPGLGVYLWSAGRIRPIAVPGGSLPDGGALVTAFAGADLANSGEIAFTALLDTLSEHGVDSGVYVWAKGDLKLVARTGSTVPGPDGNDVLLGVGLGPVAINSSGKVLVVGEIGRMLIPPPPPGEEPPPPPPPGAVEPPPPPPPPPPPDDPPPPVVVREPLLLLVGTR